jgi:hypothetical protein
MRKPWPTGGCWAMRKKMAYSILYTILNSMMFAYSVFPSTSTFRSQFISVTEEYLSRKLKTLFRKLWWRISVYILVILVQELTRTEAVALDTT